MAITYEEALDVLQEGLPYIVQKKDPKTGEWRNIGPRIKGREAAYKALGEMKQEPRNKDVQLRVLPKNEADKYREGIHLGRKLGPEEEEEEERPRRRLPLLVLPERL